MYRVWRQELLSLASFRDPIVTLAVFPQCLKGYERRGPKEQTRHRRGDNQVGPGSAGRRYAARRQNDGDIADGVVAAAQLHGADIGLAVTEARECTATRSGHWPRRDGSAGVHSYTERTLASP